jgi:phosphatidylglycerol:prolipoprotein diacylglycerol transferase
VQPIAFHLGPLPVHWYGVTMAVAFLMGLWTASRRALREGVAPEKIIDLGPWLILGAILGARLLYVITFWREQFAGNPISEIFKVWRGGLVFYGGLIGASLAFILYARLKKLPLWKGADIMAPSIALGYFFGRIGCLMYGCCYGRPCKLPWAIQFPAGSLAFKDQAAQGLLGPDAIKSLPIHPTQLYESFLNLGLYFALAWLYRRKKFDGQVFATYLVAYALLRSFVEIFRGDYPQYQHYLGGWATPAQLASIAILAAGLILLCVLPRPIPAAR